MSDDGPPPPPGEARAHARAPAPRARRPSWSLVLVAALLLLVVAVAFQGLQREGVGGPAGVERSEEPAETARNLAAWLHERAGR